MRSSRITEHLDVAAKLARDDGNVFLEYLIRMAITVAEEDDRTRLRAGVGGAGDPSRRRR